ncbi:hypothetical protein [Nucisporomicrobium flavum]|uniref:hypothetical protein n=1 Tax=Nucisporomicrobium flavum TaxID=2785915 RepID=UPI0018F3CDD1|nr:hypothetical protein [Nucisporomicrobium flavum]
MTEPDPAATLRRFAEECVALVGQQYGRRLDWSPESLDELDEVCELLLADGPLPDERLDLWWKLVGAYAGEVLIRAHGGSWTMHDAAQGAYAVSVQGMTALPFSTAQRVLSREPYKSLGSFVRAFPAILERGRGAGKES